MTLRVRQQFLGCLLMLLVAVAWGDSPMPGQAWSVPGLDMALLSVNAGRFTMGDDQEIPQQDTTITYAFWMAAKELTNAQYQTFVQASGYESGRHADGDYLKHLQSGETETLGNHPVVWVSWKNARAFCRWLTKTETAAKRLPKGYVYRLPSEAEWEYACRAGSTTRFNFGDDWQELKAFANFADASVTDSTIEWHSRKHDDGFPTTAPVGSYRPNAWGFFDMHGNVLEWCNDWHGPYSATAVTDPRGPKSGAMRVCRGGSWFSWTWACRSAQRSRYGHTRTFPFVGFRVVLAPK